jgi:hypothetical protein
LLITLPLGRNSLLTRLRALSCKTSAGAPNSCGSAIAASPLLPVVARIAPGPISKRTACEASGRTYCDVIHGNYPGSSCTGPVITVDANGWFAANIPAHDAVAIHIGARTG